MNSHSQPQASLDRREFLQRGGVAVCAGATSWTFGTTSMAGAEKADTDKADTPDLRIGLITDVHYADRPAQGSRHFRDAIDKVRVAVEAFNEAKLETLVFLGDLIDEAKDVAGEIGHLKTIEAELAKFRGERHYVLGNHCVWTLTKQQFADNCAGKAKHYSFDVRGYHFVILDACYRKDGVAYGGKNFVWNDCDIPREQQEWLRDDLKKTDKPTIVFAHERLDVKGDHAALQSPAVRKIMEESGRVRAVLMGHSHQNDYKQIGGIHYAVLRAVIEGSGKDNNAYSRLDLFGSGRIQIDGFSRQIDYDWRKQSA